MLLMGDIAISKEISIDSLLWSVYNQLNGNSPKGETFDKSISKR